MGPRLRGDDGVLTFVMAGLDPAIHVFLAAKSWMPGTSPGMTSFAVTADSIGCIVCAYPATCLMRAISSSTAWSTGTFSLTTRFIALAQTFSLFRMVNL